MSNMLVMSKVKDQIISPRRFEIRQIAARLFHERGYAATGMRAIAAEAGMEASSLYNHIGSKSDLLADICFSMADQFIRQLDDLEASDATLQQQLGSVLRFHMHMMIHAYHEVYVANHEWKHLPGAELSRFLQVRRHYESKLTRLIEKGIESGEFRPVDPWVAVITLLSAIRGIEYWHRNAHGLSARRLEHDMITQLLEGIKQPR
jgi:AcrR family transcriptional regulator